MRIDGEDGLSLNSRAMALKQEKSRYRFFMAALCNRAGHYILACPLVSFYLLLSSSFFFSSPNLSGRRLDVYHTLTHGVALVRI